MTHNQAFKIAVHHARNFDWDVEEILADLKELVGPRVTIKGDE